MVDHLLFYTLVLAAAAWESCTRCARHLRDLSGRAEISGLRIPSTYGEYSNMCGHSKDMDVVVELLTRCWFIFTHS